MSCLLNNPSRGCAERSSQIPHEPEGRLGARISQQVKCTLLCHWKDTKTHRQPCNTLISCPVSVDTVSLFDFSQLKLFQSFFIHISIQEGDRILETILKQLQQTSFRWFQLLKCVDLLLFSVLHHCKCNILL